MASLVERVHLEGCGPPTIKAPKGTLYRDTISDDVYLQKTGLITGWRLISVPLNLKGQIVAHDGSQPFALDAPADDGRIITLDTAAPGGISWKAPAAMTQGRIELISTTSFALFNSFGDIIEVRDEAVEIGPVPAITTSTSLINAAGAETGGGMAASTLYYIYQSNSAPAVKNVTRASLTAPTRDAKGVYYLGITDNAAHWRFLGWVFTNASTQLESNLSSRHIGNYYNRILRRIFLTPGRVDDNLETSFTHSGSSWSVINAGVGSVGSYISNGEDSSFFSLSAAGSGANGGLGIGDDSAVSPVVATDNLPTSFFGVDMNTAAFSVVGRRTVQMLGRKAGGGSFTIIADYVRNGAASDPIASALIGSVMT